MKVGCFLFALSVRDCSGFVIQNGGKIATSTILKNQNGETLSLWEQYRKGKNEEDTEAGESFGDPNQNPLAAYSSVGGNSDQNPSPGRSSVGGGKSDPIAPVPSSAPETTDSTRSSIREDGSKNGIKPGSSFQLPDLPSLSDLKVPRIELPDIPSFKKQKQKRDSALRPKRKSYHVKIGRAHV